MTLRRPQIAGGIVGKRLLQHGQQGERVLRTEQQRVTIGLRLRGATVPTTPLAPAAIVHEHRNSEPLRHRLRQCAGNDIGRGAGGIGHDDADRLVRIGLRPCRP